MKRLTALLCLLIALPALAQEGHNHDHNHAEAAPKDPAKMAELLQPTDNDVALGEPDAPLTLVEYSSLSCSHCAHFHTTVLPKLKKEFIETGKLYFINRDFPLNAPAFKAAILVQCAPVDKRAEFYEVLFKLQSKWAFTPDYMDGLKKIAAVGGIDNERFGQCMDDKALEEQVLQQRKIAGEALPIQGTPSFFLNGEPLQVPLTPEAFRKALRAELEKE